MQSSTDISKKEVEDIQDEEELTPEETDQLTLFSEF